MGDLYKFFEMNWRSGVLFMAAVLVIAVFLIQKTDWLCERLGLTSKRRLAEED